jgi:hypothetical protein
MDRDRRLTGMLRGQTDNAAAPLGFELNNPWRVCLQDPCIIKKISNLITTARETNDLRLEWLTGALGVVHTYLCNQDAIGFRSVSPFISESEGDMTLRRIHYSLNPIAWSVEVDGTICDSAFWTIPVKPAL